MQNLAPAGFNVPHLGQLTPACNGEPQLLQNLALWGFWKLHFGHRIIVCGDAGVGCWKIGGIIANPAPTAAPGLFERLSLDF